MPVAGWILALVLSLALGIGSFVLWVLLIVNAARGREWQAPLVGRFARQSV